MRQVRTSDQEYQSAWLEWDILESIPDQILSYCEDEFWVYDADVCGWRDIQFVVRENNKDTHWKVEHAWWIETDLEWQLKNEFDVTQIESVSFSYPSLNRDWLKLTLL
jgi:hypothetical protein